MLYAPPCTAVSDGWHSEKSTNFEVRRASRRRFHRRDDTAAWSISQAGARVVSFAFFPCFLVVVAV